MRMTIFTTMPALWLLCLGTQPAFAADDKQAGIQVMEIHATTKNNDVSDELKDIAATLKKQFKYTGFELEKTKTSTTRFGKTFVVALEDGYKAHITPKARAKDNRVRLDIKFTKREKDKDVPKLKTTITIKAGKSQLLGGWKIDNGDALIVAISAK